jgi:hypothetical protein
MSHTPTRATPTDHAALAHFIFDAVRNGPSLYTEAQRAAWVPERRGGAVWDARFAAKDIVLGYARSHGLFFLPAVTCTEPSFSRDLNALLPPPPPCPSKKSIC